MLGTGSTAQKVIWKYKLSIDPNGFEPIFVPPDYEILSVGLDPNDDLCVWIAVDPELIERKPIFFAVVGTGFAEPHGVFLGTVRMQPFMWHVFAREQQ